jgi:diguanylate cyclase (GGDEF)-like protein
VGEAPDITKRCILAVDDDRILLAKLERGMRDAGYEILPVTSGEQALQAIASRIPDLALLDISMPGMSGIELAKHLRQNTAIPFMFLSSHQDADLARQAAENGAVAYQVKSASISTLIPAIEAALVRSEEIRHLRGIGTELAAELVRMNRLLDLAQRRVQKSRAHAREMARKVNIDTLTGLPNRNWLEQHLPAALERSRRSGRMLAVLYLDLDGFKAINDTMGHPAGDELLRAAARRMKSVLKPCDAIARHGGDEFIIIVEQVVSESDASHVASRMAEVLKNPFELSHGRSSVGASIGISLYPRDAGTAQDLVRNADLAMYHAKSRGKGHYRFYEPD